MILLRVKTSKVFRVWPGNVFPLSTFVTLYQWCFSSVQIRDVIHLTDLTMLTGLYRLYSWRDSNVWPDIMMTGQINNLFLIICAYLISYMRENRIIFSIFVDLAFPSWHAQHTLYHIIPTLTSLVTINAKNNLLTLIMSKSSLMYLKLMKLEKYLPQIYFKLKNHNIDTANNNVKVCSLTQILMVNFPTSNWVHAFEVAFTVIFSYLSTYFW